LNPGTLNSWDLESFISSNKIGNSILLQLLIDLNSPYPDFKIGAIEKSLITILLYFTIVLLRPKNQEPFFLQNKNINSNLTSATDI